MSRNEVLIDAFAAELRAQRAARRLSQEDLAHLAQVNRTYIAKLELARNQPTLGVLFRIATALEIDLPALLEATLRRYQRIGRRSPNGAHRQSSGR
jgi:transcriptional regulator with XRE-family HTH domain